MRLQANLNALKELIEGPSGYGPISTDAARNKGLVDSHTKGDRKIGFSAPASESC